MGANYARGLDLVTRVIHASIDVEFARPEALAIAITKRQGTQYIPKTNDANCLEMNIEQCNRLFANIIRIACQEGGFMAGWSFLVQVAPDLGLPSQLVEDVCTAADIYSRIKIGARGSSHAGASMMVGSEATYDSVSRIGPKSLGGNAWRASEEYLALLKNPTWSNAGYAKGIPPCVAMGWIGVQMKITPPIDAPEVVKLQLLGTIDFDMDHMNDNKAGFQSGFDTALVQLRAVGTKLRGAALIGMLNYDLQNHIRPIQNEWAIENRGPWNLGPKDVSPSDWVAYLVADCAALVPFAYDEDYYLSRTGMINGMIHLQCQDLLFDAGCSNRVATVPYVEAAGVAKYGMSAAYAIASYEETAKYFLDNLISCHQKPPPFGYSACLVAGPWGPFGTRYRVWERCVKYTRQLKRSTAVEAHSLLELSTSDFMLRDYSLEKDVGEEWGRAMKSGSSDLVRRRVAKYFVTVNGSDLFRTPGVHRPHLCAKCEPLFDKIMASCAKEEIRAAEGLPPSVTTGLDVPEQDTFTRPAGLAAGLRRAAMWAYSDDCCDVCASRIGSWADAAAYSVLTALMHDEPLLSAPMWMLQNYFVGCVAFWPISLPFLLSGFDLLADLSFEQGAMGTRDVVDI